MLNAETMSLQEIFEASVTHLFNQGRQSANPGGDFCLYRGPDGLKCAAGIFLDDDAAQRADKCPASSWDRIYKHTYPDMGSGKVALIVALQSLHDNEDNWTNTNVMRSAAIRVANVARLSSPPVSLDTKFLTNLSFSDR